MTLDQLIAEVASKPTQVEAFKTLLECLAIEMHDASYGDSPPPSVKGKYEAVFSGAVSKANEILNAIENGKPALDPVRVAPVPASSPGGPVSPSVRPTVFLDKPIPPPIVTADGTPPNPPSPTFATSTSVPRPPATTFTGTATTSVSPPFSPTTTGPINPTPFTSTINPNQTAV